MAASVRAAMRAQDAGPPPPPPPWQAAFLRRAMALTWARGLYGAPQDPPPREWGAQPARIPREAGGSLAALVFDSPAPRGLVLLAHPGIPPAKGYFHRGDRVPFLCELGFTVVTFDLGSFGESDPVRTTFADEWLDVLAWARRRFGLHPIHVWGVSIGGYFAHHALARDPLGVESALFEQVSPDLFRYGRRPGDALGLVERATRRLAPSAAAWLPSIAHAPFVRAGRVLHVTGTRDEGIPAAQRAALLAASRPGTGHHEVEGAAHLRAWRAGGAPLRRAVAAHLQGDTPKSGSF